MEQVYTSDGKFTVDIGNVILGKYLSKKLSS